MRGCNTNVEKKCEISKMFLRRKLGVCALSETTLNRSEVYGRVCDVMRGSAREGVALILNRWLLWCVMEWKEVSYRLMWVRVRLSKRVWCL